jgi:hypothetical protein
MEPIDQYDACDGCGKRTDGLMTCTYSHDGSHTFVHRVPNGINNGIYIFLIF